MIRISKEFNEIFQAQKVCKADVEWFVFIEFISYENLRYYFIQF